MYQIEITDEATAHIRRHKKNGSKKLVKKIQGFIEELKQHPREGTGQVERLKHYAEREIYSRRIDKKHRLVYEIVEDKVVVILISAYEHYE